MQEAAEVPEDVGELHMPQEYYTVEKAAEILGMTPAEVNLLRERNQIRAFRDGANWKFPVEEVHRLAQQRKAQAQAQQPPAGEPEELELELAGPDEEEAQTVYAPATPQSSETGDVELGERQPEEEPELELADEAAAVSPPAQEEQPTEQLQLADEEELSLADSNVPVAEHKPPSNGSGGAAINLADEGADEDLVIGGSGSGSDVTIGQDSGISLVDPHDSGLSLEEPVELTGLEDDSLALGEDDMLTLAEEADTESPTQLQAEDEFRLSTEEELPAEEESESASQMIPLDMETGEAPTEAFPGEEPGVGAAVFEEAGAGPAVGMEPAAGVPTQPAAAMEPAAVALPEAPFGALAMAGLIGSLLILALAGWMTVDLLRNMWSWNGPVELNSWLMDQILGLLG